MRQYGRWVVAVAAGLLAVATGACSQSTSEMPEPGTSSVRGVALSQAQGWGLLVGSNDLEVQSARIATGRAENPLVKAFAEHMLQSHGDAAASERHMAERLGMAVATSPELEQLATAEKQRAKSLQTLAEAMGTLHRFEQSYVESEIHEHEQIIGMLSSEIPNSLTDAQLRAHAEGQMEVERQHLDEAKRVKEQVGY